jgi:feruloyl esterase
MTPIVRIPLIALLGALFAALSFGVRAQTAAAADEAARCAAIVDIANLTIRSAVWKPRTQAEPAQCYVRGASGRVEYHVQLPPPDAWNRRFLNWGDGLHDGDLDFAHQRVAQGYAVANSNMGHDAAAEPGATFAFDNSDAQIDYAYRHVLITVRAALRVIEVFYGAAPSYSYHEGCSTGGRQGLLAAQRFPALFDGIAVEAPANFLHPLNVDHVWDMRHMFEDNFAGALAFDADGDGSLENLRKAELLRDAVLVKCDAHDGIVDRVVDDPLTCDFVPAIDLAPSMCADDVNAAACFTRAQVAAVQAIYDGPSDSRGRRISKGKAKGSEVDWPLSVIPHAGNDHFPSQMELAQDFVNFLFYERDPGVPPPSPTDITSVPNKDVVPPEFAWWEFRFDDYHEGAGDTMRELMDSDDPDMRRYLVERGGKLLITFGWADTVIPPEPMVDYYREVIDVTFGGDLALARDAARLFMAPGVNHCGGGPGPDRWDRLAPLVAWVEEGAAPDSIVATHATDGVVDNERLLCPYPRTARYTGPGDPNDSRNWRAANFTCRDP